MKKMILKLVIGLMALLVSVPGNTTDKPLNVRFEVFSQQKAFNLFIDAEQKENIEIRDEKNALIFKDKITAGTNYAKAIDLSRLPTGNYTLKVINQVRVIVQPISISNVGITIYNKDKKTIRRPSVSLENRVLMVRTGLNPAAKVNVRILSNGILLYKDEKRNSNFRSYNLSQLEKGKYSIVIETEFETTIQTISLK